MESMDRVSTIGSSILLQAEQESRRLIDKANEAREQALRACEEEVVAYMGPSLQHETTAIRLSTVSSVAAERTRERENVFRRREELFGMVFMNVKLRLNEYAKTDEYRETLLNELSKLQSGYEHSSSIIYLAEKDMHVAAFIEELLPGCKTEPDEEIKLGGWRFFNTAAAIHIDHSLDTRLNSQRQWFLKHCNLEVI